MFVIILIFVGAVSIPNIIELCREDIKWTTRVAILGALAGLLSLVFSALDWWPGGVSRLRVFGRPFILPRTFIVAAVAVLVCLASAFFEKDGAARGVLIVDIVTLLFFGVMLSFIMGIAAGGGG